MKTRFIVRSIRPITTLTVIIVMSVLVGCASLRNATAKGDLNTVSKLLTDGADVNEKTANGITPLMTAAASGNEPLSRLLIEHGADVNAKTNDGINALMNATAKRHTDIAKLN